MPAIPTIRTVNIVLNFDDEQIAIGDTEAFVTKTLQKDAEMAAFSQAMLDVVNDMNAAIDEINGLPLDNVTVAASQLVGNNVSTTFPFYHGLENLSVRAFVVDAVDGSRVTAHVTTLPGSGVSIAAFENPPASNAYRMIVTE